MQRVIIVVESERGQFKISTRQGEKFQILSLFVSLYLRKGYRVELLIESKAATMKKMAVIETCLGLRQGRLGSEKMERRTRLFAPAIWIIHSS